MAALGVSWVFGLPWVPLLSIAGLGGFAVLILVRGAPMAKVIPTVVFAGLVFGGLAPPADGENAQATTAKPAGPVASMTPPASTAPQLRAAADPEPPKRRRMLWTGLAGIGACVVGLFWGRWLEGSPRDDEDGPGDA